MGTKSMMMCKCAVCGTEFHTRAVMVTKHGRGKTCSVLCRGRYIAAISHGKPVAIYHKEELSIALTRPYIREERTFKTCWQPVQPWSEA